MLLAGWLIIMAAVLGLIPQPLWLGLAAYSLTLLGFAIGIYGVAMYVHDGQQKR